MYPPRPKFRIPPEQLQKYESQGNYVVQRKFNGTRTLVHITPDGNVEAWRPGKQPLEQWVMTTDIAEQFLSITNRGKEYWFDGELLNNKTSSQNYKSKIVLFDILQAGRYLFGTKLLKRYELLAEICGNPNKREPNGIALQVTDNIWLAEVFFEDFPQRYQDFIDQDEIEGLVLKDRNSALDNFGNKKYEVGWQIRCRKTHKNYAF